jgi:hypothetical protein
VRQKKNENKNATKIASSSSYNLLWLMALQCHEASTPQGQPAKKPAYHDNKNSVKFLPNKIIISS